MGDADIAHKEQPRGETKENEDGREIPPTGARMALQSFFLVFPITTWFNWSRPNKGSCSRGKEGERGRLALLQEIDCHFQSTEEIVRTKTDHQRTAKRL